MSELTNIPAADPRAGKVLPPVILWMLGVPGGVCLLLWLFFFRG